MTLKHNNMGQLRPVASVIHNLISYTSECWNILMDNVASKTASNIQILQVTGHVSIVHCKTTKHSFLHCGFEGLDTFVDKKGSFQKITCL